MDLRRKTGSLVLSLRCPVERSQKELEDSEGWEETNANSLEGYFPLFFSHLLAQQV